MHNRGVKLHSMSYPTDLKSMRDAAVGIVGVPHGVQRLTGKVGRTLHQTVDSTVEGHVGGDQQWCHTLQRDTQ